MNPQESAKQASRVETPVAAVDARAPAGIKDLAPRILESSHDCMEVLDLEGRLLSINSSGLKALEISDSSPMRSGRWSDFWQGEDRVACEAALAAAKRGEVGRFVGLLPTTQTRKSKWCDVVVSAILGADGKPEKLLATLRDVTEWKRSQELLGAIIEGTAGVTGIAFFRSLVQHLARGLHVRWAFVAECLPNFRARSLAFWDGRDFGEDFEYALPGTPCLEVAQGRTCHVPDRLTEVFPQDRGMIEMGTMSYLGVPLLNSEKRIIGHLVVFDDKPMPADELALSVMETFAARAGAELERQQALEELRRQARAALAESEQRFRDLFDEAPIAYVHEGVDTRFIRANAAAMRILGIRPDQIDGTYGKSFVPDTPDAQRRLREAFESVGKGTDTSGVVLELRRKDNGKPVWIQWWSKPAPDGAYTRTMFIDITERVLMEKEKERLQAQNVYLQEEIRSEHNFDEIVGNSPALLEVLGQVDQVAPTDSTVLILGETGTGKELIARAIHDRSPRRERPLVKVNCGAISAGLVESELFGHVKGAFTGALTSREGRFKLAHGGTIFLDEVAELPLETQVKLLRVLQEQEFEPVGASQTVRVNVRVIAATNRDLKVAVSDGKFRSDLFYRLNVFPVHNPPLRERSGDVPLLAMFFLQRFAKKFGKPLKQISEQAMRELMAYRWPGNIRELQNVIERAVIISQGNTLVLADDFGAKTGSGQIAVADAPPAPRSQPASAPRGAALEDVERHHIESVLKHANWMIEGERGAARILNLQPSTLRSRMQKLGIKRPAKSA